MLQDPIVSFIRYFECSWVTMSSNKYGISPSYPNEFNKTSVIHRLNFAKSRLNFQFK